MAIKPVTKPMAKASFTTVEQLDSYNCAKSVLSIAMECSERSAAFGPTRIFVDYQDLRFSQ